MIPIRRHCIGLATRFDANHEKKNLLALSALLPFASFQQAVHERALGGIYNIVTVGPADLIINKKMR